MPGQLRPPSTQAPATKKEDGNDASPYQQPRIRRGRAWLEILPVGLRDPDVVRAKALSRTRTSRGPLARSPEGGLPDVFPADYELFHLEGDLP